MGFFSIGSTWTATGKPQVTAVRRPSMFTRTRQSPACPGPIRQRRGQSSHWTTSLMTGGVSHRGAGRDEPPRDRTC